MGEKTNRVEIYLQKSFKTNNKKVKRNRHFLQGGWLLGFGVVVGGVGRKLSSVTSFPLGGNQLSVPCLIPIVLGGEPGTLLIATPSPHNFIYEPAPESSRECGYQRAGES